MIHAGTLQSVLLHSEKKMFSRVKKTSDAKCHFHTIKHNIISVLFSPIVINCISVSYKRQYDAGKQVMPTPHEKQNGFSDLLQPSCDFAHRTLWRHVLAM
jgi:hypothetical protein